MQPVNLFTIGYEDRNIAEFIVRLQKNGIETLIDVRETPISRKPGFSKSKLSKHLETANIKYIHIRELGSPKTLRRELDMEKDYNHFFYKFEKYLNTRIKILESLYRETITNEISCLMCMERDPSYCHRILVAEKIKEVDGNGLKIKHI
jgi:uncharacterized protein (DUF488 family)